MRSVLLGKWRRDLARYPLSMLLLFIATAVVMAAAMAFVVTRAVLERETLQSFERALPSHAVVELEQPIAPERVEALLDRLLDEAGRGEPDSGLASLSAVVFERELSVRVRALREDAPWRACLVSLRSPVASFDGTDIAKVVPGPQQGEPAGLWVENSSLSLVDLDKSTASGSALEVRFPNGVSAEPQQVPVAGAAFDGAKAPGWMEGMVYAYLHRDPKQQARLSQHAGLVPGYDRLLVRFKEVSPGATRLDQRRELASLLAERSEALGLEVALVKPGPALHPHHGHMKALVLTVLVLGGLVLVLAVFLMATAVQLVLRRERETLAVLKALGANSRQSLLALSPAVGVASAVTLPVGGAAGWFLGQRYVSWAAGFLNLELGSRGVSVAQVLLAVALVLVALLVPLVLPLVKAARTSAWQVGEAARGGTASWAQAPAAHASSRGFRYAGHLALQYGLRNLRRNPLRSATLGLTLALAGTVFLGASHVSRSWQHVLDEEKTARMYDFEVRLREAGDARELEQALEGVPGVRHASAVLRDAVTLAASSQTDESSAILVAGYEQQLVLPLQAGHRLGESEPEPSSQPVPAMLPHSLASDWHAVPQDVLRLASPRLGSFDLVVVGVVRELIPVRHIYVHPRALASLRRSAALEPFSSDMALVTSDDELRPGRDLRPRLEEHLASKGWAVGAVSSVGGYERSLRDHVLIFRITLGVVCALLAAIALFALVSMLALDVLERRSELATLRALGASKRQLQRILSFEGVVLAGLGVALGFLLALPLALLVGRLTGFAFLRAALPFQVSWGSVLCWGAALSFCAWAACHLALRRVVAEL